MIDLPTKGFAKSVTKHNIDLNVLCDWIEGSLLFYEDKLSFADIVDRLQEEEIYIDSDFAGEIVQAAKEELDRRHIVSGVAYAVSVEGVWFSSHNKWEEKLEHSFCLLLSLATTYDWWHKEFGPDYTEQGELFELLIDKSLKVSSPGWETFLTGWNRSNPIGFKTIAQEVANRITGGIIDLELWNTKGAKELALDLLYYRPFSDKREGFPYFLIQCASGENWERKIKEPDLAVWRSILNPATTPMRGFAVPFCYSDDSDFKRNCTRTEGLFLDRCRILSAFKTTENSLSVSVKTRISEWLEPRIEKLRARAN
ncbi:MAG: hypothetical protein L3J71_04945 [Victivallaceae bacterium]|nr:hypothetical protein [Victivallaceae bacterium]